MSETLTTLLLPVKIVSTGSKVIAWTSIGGMEMRGEPKPTPTEAVQALFLQLAAEHNTNAFIAIDLALHGERFDTQIDELRELEQALRGSRLAEQLDDPGRRQALAEALPRRRPLPAPPDDDEPIDAELEER